MKFVIATHNKGKVVEFKRMLEPMGIEVVTAELSEPEENGTTFGENAFIKADSACKETGLPAVADDSGLCVDYLDGAPGIYSARFAEPGKRRLTVLEKLKGVPEEQRGAHFVSAVCCVFPNGDTLTRRANATAPLPLSPGGRTALATTPSLSRTAAPLER